jgi:hypothetical protein
MLKQDKILDSIEPGFKRLLFKLMHKQFAVLALAQIASAEDTITVSITTTVEVVTTDWAQDD